MNHELICAWFGLPNNDWPPDHYRLLGLEPGEDDVGVIEQRVHQRLDSVRPYQMMHPEQATEAMNRLAQAFVCLTEPGAKKAYDDQLLGPRDKFPVEVTPANPPVPAPAPPAAPASVPQPPPLPPQDPLQWLYTPGANGPGEAPATEPQRPSGVLPPPLPAPAAEVKQAEVAVKPPVPAPQPPPPAPAEPIDPVIEAAQRSPQARSGLITRRNFYQRISQTRHLLRLWHRLGRHLREAKQKWSKEDAREVYKLIEQIEEAVESFPLLGEAGQPGYLIVSLGHLDKSRALLNLTVGERESLKRDWSAGLKFLEAHRDFLRAELVVLRQRGPLARLIMGIRAQINERPLTVVLVVGAILALVIAFSRWLP